MMSRLTLLVEQRHKEMDCCPWLVTYFAALSLRTRGTHTAAAPSVQPYNNKHSSKKHLPLQGHRDMVQETHTLLDLILFCYPRYPSYEHNPHTAV